jgi:hypothetical protein
MKQTSTTVPFLRKSNPALGAAGLAAVSGGMPSLHRTDNSRDLRSDNARDRESRYEGYFAEGSRDPGTRAAAAEAEKYGYSPRYYRNSPYPTVKDKYGTAEGWRPAGWR